MSIHRGDSMLFDHMSYVDEVPRFWFSRRWRLAFLGFIGFLIVTFQRVSIEVAIVSMLNHTATPVTASPSYEAGSSRGYWATRLGMAAPGRPVTGGGLGLGGADGEVALAYSRNANGTQGEEKEDTRTTTMTTTTTTKSRGLEDLAVGLWANSSCSNTSELAILNTTLFTLIPRGEISWTVAEQSGVLDAFYWGDLLIRIPSGLLSQRYGGKRIFGFSLLVSSICTAVIPISSRVHCFAVILLRFITGISTGATVPALSYILGRWSPPDERCLLQSIANTGTGVSGTLITVPVIGLLCIYGFVGGWPSAFYISGGLGMVWSIIWMILANDTPSDDSRISVEEKDYINSAIQMTRSSELLRSVSYASSSSATNSEGSAVYRWEVALTSLPVLALAVCHFTHEWVVCVLTKVIPIYLYDVRHMDFKQNSIGTLVLPSVGFWSIMTLSAGAADRLQAYGVLGANKIRKLMQTAGAVVTAAMLASVLLMNCQLYLATLSIVTIGLSFCGLQYSGALVAHLDVAPGCAAVTLGFASTLGSSVYFVLPALLRMMLQSSPNQSIELKWIIFFLLTASCHLFGAFFFLIFGSGRPHNWLSGRPSVTATAAAAADGEVVQPGAGGNVESVKISMDNGGVGFDSVNTNFDSANTNSYGYLSNNHRSYHRPQLQQQQQNQQDDVYHEALDLDPNTELDTDSSNRSVTGVQVQLSDDSSSHSCVSAASEISAEYLPPSSRPLKFSDGADADTEADDRAPRSCSINRLTPPIDQNDLSESIV